MCSCGCELALTLSRLADEERHRLEQAGACAKMTIVSDGIGGYSHSDVGLEAATSGWYAQLRRRLETWLSKPQSA